MGRKRKYSSEADRKAAQRKWSREYYHRNKSVLQAKARNRYRKKKEMERKEKSMRELYGE